MPLVAYDEPGAAPVVISKPAKSAAERYDSFDVPEDEQGPVR